MYFTRVRDATCVTAPNMKPLILQNDQTETAFSEESDDFSITESLSETIKPITEAMTKKTTTVKPSTTAETVTRSYTTERITVTPPEETVSSLPKGGKYCVCEYPC